MRKTAIHKKIDSFGEMKQWRGKGSPFGAHLKVLTRDYRPAEGGKRACNSSTDGEMLVVTITWADYFTK